MNIQYTILRPGGNDTALVLGTKRSLKERKVINDQLMAKYPNVEQVGFVNLDPQSAELVMAGGEFCGNAARSTAWLALDGKPGDLLIKVSGVSSKLKAGVKENGDAWSQMPIYKEVSRIRDIGDDVYIVEMDGITQVVMLNPFNTISEEKIKAFTKKELQRLGLLESVPAAGIMFYSQVGEKIKIEPVVWVRDIQTLFYESACGSGTTAVGLVQALKKGKFVKQSILQPSGMAIDVQVKFDGNEFSYAEISGPVTQLKNERKTK